MAAPNLKAPAQVIGRTARYAATTSLAAALSNPSNSNEVFKINTIICTNITATAATITISHFDGTNDFRLASVLSIPANTSVKITDRASYFYVEEGHSIRAQAGTASAIQVIIGYEDIM